MTNITWSIMDSSKIISKNNYYNKTTLQIKNVTLADSANYSCFAVSPFGNDSSFVTVSVISKYINKESKKKSLITKG